MDELDEVLDVAQRQKRAQILRRYKAKIERAREIAKKRMAPEKNIKKRAYAQARQIVRRRVAGKRGAEYEKLGPSEKMAIDRAVEGKQKLIKKIALRLIPRVKQAEQQRLSAFMKGKALQNHGKQEGGSGQSSVQEELDTFFSEQFPPMAERSERKQPKETTDKTMRKKGGKEAKGNSNIIQYGKFEEERDCDSPAYKAIAKKARKSGISEDILGEVYDRGMDAWYEETGVSQQQYAFARVNSFINQGKTYFNEDADLHEATEKHYYVTFNSMDHGKKLLHKKNKPFTSMADAKDHIDRIAPGHPNRRSLGRIHTVDKNTGRILKVTNYDTQNTGYPYSPELGDAKHVKDLHELSSKALDNYIQKSQSHWGQYNAQAKHAQTQDERDYGEKMRKRRNKGMVQAYDKLDAATGRTPEKPVKVPARMKEDLDEGTMKPYVKPHYGDSNNPDKQTGWKSANKHGKTKYWQMFAKNSAEKHAGINEELDESYSHLSTAELRKHAEEAIRKNDRQKVRALTQEIKSRIEKKTGAPYVAPDKYSKKTASDYERITGKKVPAHRVEEVQQTNENFIDGKGPGKPGDAARHGLKGKSAAQLRKIRSSETASPRAKQLAHWMLNMHHNEETELDEKRGLWDNIHAKRKRIAAGSGERMRKPGSKGAPTAQDFKDAQESFVSEEERIDPKTKVEGTNCRNCVYWRKDLEKPVTKEELNPNGGLKAPNKEYIAMSKRIDLGTLPGKDNDVKVKGFCDHDMIKDWVTERMCCSQWDSDGMIRDYKGQSPVMKEEGESIVPQTTSAGSRIRRKIEKVDRAAPHTEHGKQQAIQKKIIDEEGNSQPDPKKRLIGTASLVKAFKKDTPGQSLDESFNIAFASGVGVTLTARDLGMQTQGGFALHPSVIKEMEEREQEEVEEEVRSADVKGVVVRTASGKTVVRKQKANRKIIGSGNLTDGKPDDEEL